MRKFKKLQTHILLFTLSRQLRRISMGGILPYIFKWKGVYWYTSFEWALIFFNLCCDFTWNLITFHFISEYSRVILLNDLNVRRSPPYNVTVTVITH